MVKVTQCSDALGRTVTVKDNNGAITQYTYDALDNPITVSVEGQTRAFEYSSLSRMLKACNPETGTATCVSPLAASGLESYTYDANGNILTKTDARGITTRYSGYDALNRPSTIAYTKVVNSVDVPEGTPTVTWSYDQDFKGALSGVSVTKDSATYSTAYTHDAVGRISASTQNVASIPYTFSYKYSLADRLEEMTYPSGRVVKYLPDSAGRVSTIQNGTSGNYASIAYGNAGIPTMTMGNGIVETTAWNSRFQVTGLTAQKPPAAAALSLGFFRCAGLAATCTTGNNGTLRSQTIASPAFSATQTYTYDGINRLQTAAEAGTGAWTEGYKQSNVGNMWYDTAPGVRTGLPSLSDESPQSAAWFLANNRINGWGTGASGNLESQGGLPRTFTYDAENRQITATVSGVASTYIYDGEGQRVRKTVNGVTTTYVYDASGELAAEYTTQASASMCGTATCYLTVDHLGSTRLLTDSTGAVARRYDYLPFGQELLAGTGGRTTAMGYQAAADGFNPKFTGQMRDAETGLYYLRARYYSPAQGRFTGADPENAGARMGDPQSWNGYAYVGNDPLNYTDPTGEGIFGFIGGLVGGYFGGPLGGFLGALGGNAADAAIWGPDSTKFSGAPNLAGSLGGCGGPFGNCGGINGGVWDERSPIGPRVQDPGRFIFSFEEYKNGRLVLPGGDVAIYGLFGQGGVVLKVAGKRATHDMACAGLGFAVGSTGAAAISVSQPTIDKPFSQGGTPRTSTASEAFRDWTKGARGGRPLPAFEGGPFTGRPLTYRPTNSVGGFWARWLGPTGWVLTGVAAYQMNSCLSQ